jgi:hypothetical protein
MTMTTFIVERRFNGPPESANGGYFAGLVSLLANRTMTVRLLKPPPLDTVLTLQQTTESTVEVLHGAELIATGKGGSVSIEPPPPPPHIAVVEASTRYVGFEKHPFNSCFVCGPTRSRGDGLRIFPGPLAQTTLVAAPWVPDETLDRGDGKVRPEYMWAALDCPGWHAVLGDARIALLAEITAHVDRPLRIGETCSIIGWKLSSNGRKHEAGTAIYDGNNVLCARARALWIEPRPTSG